MNKVYVLIETSHGDVPNSLDTVKVFSTREKAEAALKKCYEDILDMVDGFDLIKNKLVYEVWLIGYDADMNVTDFEWYIDGEYTEEVEARKCFEYLSDKDNLNEFIETRNVIIPDNTKHIHLMLEMCVELEDGSKECQDIIDEVEIY